MQLDACWPQVTTLHCPIIKLDPKTVMVEPKYGGLGHRGKLAFTCGITTCSDEPPKITTSLGFSKLMRTIQLPREVPVETTTKAVDPDATLHDRAGTEHTDAEHALANFKKFIP